MEHATPPNRPIASDDNAHKILRMHTMHWKEIGGSSGF